MGVAPLVIKGEGWAWPPWSSRGRVLQWSRDEGKAGGDLLVVASTGIGTLLRDRTADDLA